MTAGDCEPYPEEPDAAAFVSAGTIDMPITLICATAALTREKPKIIDFMMLKEGGDAAKCARNKTKGRS